MVLLSGNILAPLLTGKRISVLVTSLGNLTYASYLIHFPIQLVIALFYSLIGIGIPASSRIMFSLYVCGIFILSYFIYRFFELPLTQYLRNKLLRKCSVV
jgi:peptidoglycan/LPS O-acetylase OafA/YrhL